MKSDASPDDEKNRPSVFNLIYISRWDCCKVAFLEISILKQKSDIGKNMKKC